MSDKITQMTAKARKANAGRKLEEAQNMLKHVSPYNHDTVGIILGREFDRSDEAWELYKEWTGRDDTIMQECFHEKSRDSELTMDTIRHLAIKDGRHGGKKPLKDFLAHLPTHKYIYRPTRELWPAPSVDESTVWPKGENKQAMKPSRWLARHAAVESMTWAPGEPEIIEGRMMDQGGWVEHPGIRTFNLYLPPRLGASDPDKAGPWLDHLRTIYPDDDNHIRGYLAHRVQKPGEKPNHALVLGGAAGSGKDTALEPVKRAVGPWNWGDIKPEAVMGRFNGFLQSVVLRINEARDLGDVSRYAFYEHMKVLLAAPPDALYIDRKGIPEYYVPNVCGVVITTNHKSDGLYLTPDDRRHYVAWSPLSENPFPDTYWQKLWGWYENGGYGHVAAYLRQLDLSDFKPKAPPPKTEAFWNMVRSGRPQEESELAAVLEILERPSAVTLEVIKIVAKQNEELSSFADWLGERGNRRRCHTGWRDADMSQSITRMQKAGDGTLKGPSW